MPPGHAADRSRASSSARAGRLPGTPLRPGRGRGNSAAARPPPADVRSAAWRRSRRDRSRDLAPGQEQFYRPDFEYDLFVPPDLLRLLDRFLERGAIDDVEAE